MAVTPLSRSQEALEFHPNGKPKIVHCYNPGANKYFYNERGKLELSDPAYCYSATKDTVDDYFYRPKGYASVGVRRDGAWDKFLGIRPDVCRENGKEQLEFSLVKSTVDSEYHPLGTKWGEVVDDRTLGLGNLLVSSTGSRTRVIVQVIRTLLQKRVVGFEFTFKINPVGLRLIIRKDLDEFWFYSVETGEFRFRIVKPSLVNLDTLQPVGLAEDEEHLLGLELVKHSLTDNGDGTFTYVKVPGKDFDPAILPKSFGVDVETAYSTTADGYARERAAGWTNTREGTGDGSSVTTTSDGLGAWDRLDGNFENHRGFFSFNLAAISGTITSVALKLFTQGTTYHDSSQIACATTATTPFSNVSYNDLADLDSGSFGSSGSWSAVDGGLNTITFNAAGITYVQDGLGGTLNVMSREGACDYDNVQPNTQSRNSCYFSEQAGDYMPYLEIELAAASGFIPRIMILN